MKAVCRRYTAEAGATYHNLDPAVRKLPFEEDLEEN